MENKTIRSILFFSLIIASSTLLAQGYSNKVVGKNQQGRIDSLKNTEYPHKLPILGAKAHKAGFILPKPLGIGINYLWQESEIIINNLSVGFNNSEMVSLDEVIRFDKTTSEANAINIRPDIWILPFLNIYGIFSKLESSTDVNFGVWVPKDDIWEETFSAQTKAEFSAITTGFGLTPTIGVGGGWFALDMNFTWTDIDELDKPASAFVFGPRIGKSISLKNKKRSFNFWVGGFRLKINTGTNGSLPLSSMINTDDIEQKIADGYVTVEQAHTSNTDWWNGLTDAEKSNPINKNKYETKNSAIETSASFLNKLENGVNGVNESTVQYSLDKKPADMWNFLVGAQFQLNKHLMIRGEYGFLNSRNQFIGGLQYRFGL